jgi:hypothetical protein
MLGASLWWLIALAKNEAWRENSDQFFGAMLKASLKNY